jgi:hypothetical protein
MLYNFLVTFVHADQGKIYVSRVTCYASLKLKCIHTRDDLRGVTGMNRF